MKNLSLVIFLLQASVCLGQISGFSIHVSANQPWMPASIAHDESTTITPLGDGRGRFISTSETAHQDFKMKSGFSAGGNIRYSLTDRVYLSTGLAVNFVRFKQRITVEHTEWVYQADIDDASSPETISTSGSTVRYFENNGNLGKTKVWFVQMPLLVGTSLGKSRFSIEGGAVLSYAAYASAYYTDYISIGPWPMTAMISELGNLYAPPRIDESNTTEQYTPVSIGGLIKAGYRISERFQVDLGAQTSINPMFKDGANPILKNSGTPKMRLTTFSFGVSYLFKKTRIQ